MKEHAVSPIVRPVLLFSVGFITVGVSLIAGTVEAILPGSGARFGATVMGTLSQVPDSWVDLFGLMFATYAVAKSAERGTAFYTTAKYDKPARGPEDL